MKTGVCSFCLAIVLVTVSALSLNAKPHWVQDGLFTWVAYYNWLAVSAVNDSVAWAVGEDGRRAMKRHGSTFGGNWALRDLPDYEFGSGESHYHLNDVFALPNNPNYVWIVGEKRAPGSPADNHKGVVIYTENGGTSWLYTYPLRGHTDSLTPFYAVTFANANDGYIAAGNGIVLWTDDGGHNWYKTGSSPGSRSDCFRDIWTSPTNPSLIWTVSDNNSVIAKSTNAGVSWSKYQTSDFDRTYDIPDLVSSHTGKFANFGHSYVNSYCATNAHAVALSHGRVGQTTDFGESWSVDSLEPSPIWFEAVDHDPGNIMVLVSSDGVIRMDSCACGGSGGMEYSDKRFDLHDVHMVSGATGLKVGFAVGDVATSVNVGRKYMRYDPVGFIFGDIWDTCYTAPAQDSVKLEWQSAFETNTYQWRFGYSKTPYLRHHGPHYAGPEAQGNSSDTTYYEDSFTDGYNVNREMFVWISLRDSEGVHQYCTGPDSVTIDCYAGQFYSGPDKPESLIATDVPDDEGGVIELTWSPPADTTDLGEYRIGRSTSPDGPFFEITPTPGIHEDSTHFVDGTALTGIKYYYLIRAVGYYASSDDEGPDSAVAIDNRPPSIADGLKIASYRRYATNDESILVYIRWLENEVDSTIAGYWVSSQGPHQDEREIAGLAPVRRNWYSLDADWKTGDALTLGVLAMDYSDNMGQAWRDLTVEIPVTDVSLDDATADNNGNKIAQTTNGDLHIGFASQESDTNFVYYQTSTDDGKRWASPTEVGRGRDPCLGVNKDGAPYMVWRMIEVNGNDVAGKLYFSKKDEQGWTTPYEIYSTEAPYFALGPPAVATDDTGTANIVWKTRENLTGNTYADIVFVGYLAARVSSPDFNYEPVDTVWEGTPAAGPVEASPSIDLDLKDLPHVAWVKSADIYYTPKGPLGWPAAHENISASPSLDSRKPHIDLQGDWIRVVWEEEDSSSGYYDVAVWSHWKGADMETSEISTLSSNCLDPVVDGAFTLWSEKVGDHYEVFVSAYDWENYEWGDSLNISNYPHADSRYPQVLIPVNVCYEKPRIYSYWTEGPNPYWTRFQMKEFDDPENQPYILMDLGLETPSPVTVERDGYISYGASPYETVDYDTDTLRYKCNMDSTYSYTLKLTYYHEGSTGRNYELLIDGTPADTSTVPSEQKVTVDEAVPAAAVQDGQIIVEVRPICGDTVTCGEFLLFQCVQGGGKGGGQAALRRTYLPTRPILKAPYPNPSADQPVFQYFLPRRGQAVLRVFDVTGRLVETIVNDTQKPGWHKAAWNATNQASGIYFCRFNADETCVTQKFILLH